MMSMFQPVRVHASGFTATVLQPGRHAPVRNGQITTLNLIKSLQNERKTGRIRTGWNASLGFCTAEGVGSNPIGSTQKYPDLQVKRERSVKTLELIWGVVLQPILQRTFQDGLLAERRWKKFAVEQYRSKTSVIDAGAHAPRWSLIDDMTNRAGKDRD
jgi:hypothetical protein